VCFAGEDYVRIPDYAWLNIALDYYYETPDVHGID